MPLENSLHTHLHAGQVIPAHPLALTHDGRFDEQRHRALTRYYIDAGAGGIAVAVHTTQFAIRQPSVGLLEPVLALTSETADDYAEKRSRPVLKIAGVCGGTHQAVAEAELAVTHGYHAALLSLSALRDAPVNQLVDHCRAVADVIPVFGFYLQSTIGGCRLPYTFWRRFAEIDNVVAIKMAPFNRYHTIDVVRAVCESGRADDIALYTGNDDNIVVDLLTNYQFHTPRGPVSKRIVGGLLGHWAVWTRHAVDLLDRVHAATADGAPVGSGLLTEAVSVTDANAVLFDAANDYRGCIPGIHETLLQQGLLKSTRCLDPDESLSPGQAEELERISLAYPEMDDREFIAENIDSWLA